MVSSKGNVQGLLDEVWLLQNDLGLLDLEEVSKSCPTEKLKPFSNLQTASTTLQMAPRMAAAFSRSQVSTSEHRCRRLCRKPKNRRQALAQMLSSGFWTSREAGTEGLWILRRTSCLASRSKGLASCWDSCRDGGMFGDPPWARQTLVLP